MAQVQGAPIGIAEDAQDLDFGRPAMDALMPVDGVRGYATGRHEVAGTDGLGHVGLELLGRVAVAIADQDLVAME